MYIIILVFNISNVTETFELVSSLTLFIYNSYCILLNKINDKIFDILLTE